MPLLGTLSERHGVGPVCHELDIAPSTYYRHQNHRQHPEKRSQRSLRDDLLKLEIQRVYDENYSVYGVRKVWRQLRREGFRRQSFWHQRAVQETLMITPWPKASMVCTKRR